MVPHLFRNQICFNDQNNVFSRFGSNLENDMIESIIHIFTEMISMIHIFTEQPLCIIFSFIFR